MRSCPSTRRPVWWRSIAPWRGELGVEGGALWEGEEPGLGVAVLTAPTEVHVSATERCPAGCTGCYADARPDGYEPTFDALVGRLERLAARGVFHIAFGGGEAALREDIGELASEARRLGLVPTVTTSGLGITASRAAAMRSFAQVNVSWDGPDALYRAVRGYDGARVAERAIALLRAEGIPVGINTVLTRATFPYLARIAEGAEALGAVEIQLLRFKPSGRGRLDYLAQRLAPGQVRALPDVLRRLSAERRIAVRVDCAMVPFLAASEHVRPEDLTRFGVMGCEAGRSLATLRADGGVGPCSFWDGAPASHEDEGDFWADDPTLEAFRAYAAAPPEPCASCAYRAACRGGCRIVAGHVTGNAFAPDPECPRVMAHAAAAKPAR